MLIRREAEDDVEVIREVTAAAFARPGEPEPAEAGLVDALRADVGWLPALSLVAESPDGEVVGHLVATRAWVADAPSLGLGPVSVRPDWQRRGVGSALVHTIIGAADARGETMIVLLGSPDYYRRFGFRLSEEFGVVPPEADWRPHFQLRPLSAYRPDLRGQFRYATPFDEI